MRLATLLTLTALLAAGCAAPPTATPVAAKDSTAVVAIRVVPVNHTVTWQGALAAEPCGLPTTVVCATMSTTLATEEAAPQIGLKPPAMERRASDTGALFWRLSGDLRLHSSGTHPNVRLTVFVTHPAGSVERQVLEQSGMDHIALPRTDIYLEEGERDLRFLLEVPQDYEATLVEPVRIEGSLLAQAYVDAGDAPVILS